MSMCAKNIKKNKNNNNNKKKTSLKKYILLVYKTNTEWTNERMNIWTNEYQLISDMVYRAYHVLAESALNVNVRESHHR